MGNISNLTLLNGQKLMDLALNELDKRIDKLEKKGWKGTFEFKFNHHDLIYKDKEIEYKITVKLEDKGWGKYSGLMKQKFRNHYVIIINNCVNKNKQDVRNVYMHEITHVSQKFNGFLEYSHQEESNRYQRDIIAKKKKSKVSLKRYYDNRHDENLAEHEAEIAVFFQLLKENNVGGAYEFVIRNSTYFHFNFKDFVKKAYAHGASKENMLQVKQMIRTYLNNKMDEFFKHRTIYFLDSILKEYKKLTPVMRFFNLGDSYWICLLDEVKEMYEENPKMFIKPEMYIKNIEQEILLVK